MKQIHPKPFIPISKTFDGSWLSNYSSVQVLALLKSLAVTRSASAAFTNIGERWENVNPIL